MQKRTSTNATRRISTDEFFAFAGRRTTLGIFAGIVIGLLLFLVEFALAFVLQIFLFHIGLVEKTAVQVPTWLMASSTLTSALFLILGVGVCRSLLMWGQVFLSSSCFEVQRDLQRRRLVHWSLHTESLSGSRFLTLFNESSLAVGMFFTQVQVLCITGPISALLLVGLLYIAPPLTVVALVVLGVAGFGFRTLDNNLRKIAHDFLDEMNFVNQRIITNIKNLLLIQIYGIGAKEEKSILGAMNKIFGSNMHYQRLFGLKSILPQTVGLILACAITAMSVRHQMMAPVLLLSYFYLFTRFANNFSEAVKYYSLASFYWPQANLMFEWWRKSSAETSALPAVDSKLAAPEKRIGWSLENVTFGYPGSGSNILNNFNLQISPGDFLAITGESGSGKSTLLHLLLGVLSPVSGEVRLLLEGSGSMVSLNAHRASFVKKVGYVGPDSLLHEGTIRENLLYGLDRTPDAQELEDCLRRAECTFVTDLPRGLEHFISEQGQGLSAGQKQRLSLARALLRQPSVLVLDEATSNLDHRTEASIVASLSRLKGELTIVAVSHRGALAMAADRVIDLPSVSTENR